ncbi:SpvB/TcaC N-terminal domain-containing protein [uncultured Microscilla sp.]|uniref:SpvB/TcaC N-terminal domain-containing protein n=1 Tax=uncultured Microscilla sp. TaxID=432653 RepID=UPI00262F0FBE|nr:SpvB/TcaC N-terminal domain-containing protein [uncultured Microscilla sp.]
MTQENQHSKIQVQSLDLPKGGGAIEGISEKFAADGFTGTSSLSLPVYASPCRDFAPQLNLGYSSGNGNGCFGMGWGSVVAGIARKTSKGLPQYNNTDTFVYGGQDLVPLDGKKREATLNGLTYSVQEYYLRTEGSFALIEQWQPASGQETQAVHSFWKITYPDHTISIFGKRLEATIADTSDATKVKIFEWLPEESYNAKGDHQLFFYKTENSENVPAQATYEQHRSLAAQKYLQFVRYGYKESVADSMILTNHAAVNTPADWHFELVFDYGEYDLTGIMTDVNTNPYAPVQAWAYRPDPFSMYRAGFEVRTLRRCLGTMCFHRFAHELGTSEPVLVKATQYQYQADALTKLSHLVEVTETGFAYDATHEVYDYKALPPLELHYQEFTPATGSFTEILGEDGCPLPGMSNAPYQFVDLHSEGIAGILYEANHGAYYQAPVLTPASGNQTSYDPQGTDLQVPAARHQLSYAAPQPVDSFPLTNLNEAGVALRNITGTGKLDLVIVSEALKGFYEANCSDGWQAYQSFDGVPTDYAQAFQEFGDLTGKGLADLMWLDGNQVRVYPSTKAQGFANAYFADNAGNDLPPKFEKSGQEFTTLMDISGSGTPDVVRVRQNEICYWPSLGYGRFGQKITMSNCPDLGDDFDTSRLHFADLDGSGSKDLLYVQSDRLVYYLNQSGNAWAAAEELALPTGLQFSDMDHISFADLFARGTTSLVLSKSQDFPHPSHWYYDFGQQQKPYLLHKVVNNMGAETEISYRSSVDYYLQDKAADLPWITCLPFPVQVVAEVTHHDLISKVTVKEQHAYHHGYYDGEEQEFKGFGRVDSQNAETIEDFDAGLSLEAKALHTPPAFTKTWHHTGAYSHTEEDLLKQYESKEYWKGDPQALAMPDTDFVFLDNADPDNADLDKELIRQAHVSIAGAVMRTEVYGKDGTQWQPNPYSVQQTRMRVKELQPVGSHKYAVFFTHSLETMACNYERNPHDPHCTHEMVLELDEYGAVLQNCSIAYGRRAIPTEQKTAEGKLLYSIADQTSAQQSQIRFTYEQHTFAHQTSTDNFLLSVPIESKTYEVTNLPTKAGNYFTLEEVYNAATKQPKFAGQSADLQHRERHYYFDAAEEKELAFNHIALPLLPCRVAQVDFLEEQLPNAAIKTELDHSASGYVYDAVSKCYWNPGNFQGYGGAAGFYLPAYVYDALRYEGWQTNDPHKTTYGYDPYHLLKVQVTDPLENVVQAETVDYRFLHPTKMKDANDNVSEVRLDPLGMVVVSTHYGAEGNETIGFDDLSLYNPQSEPASIAEVLNNATRYLQNAATFFWYDVLAWQNGQQPVCTVHLNAKEYTHQRNAGQQPQAIAQMVHYSDGFGRTLQAKALNNQPDTICREWDADSGIVTVASANSQWMTTGATRYNNKGKAIKKYEPFFSNTFAYLDVEALNKTGVSSVLYYDALGRNLATLSPATAGDGSNNVTHYLTKPLFGYLQAGTPDAPQGYLADLLYKGLPGKLVPSPWNALQFDANDAVAASPYYATLTPAAQAQLEYAINTPHLAYHDSLGKVVQTEQINVPKEEERNANYTQRDIRGNALTETDQRLFGATPAGHNFSHVYSLTNQTIYTVSVDAGTSQALTNVVGKPFYALNSRGFVNRIAYDVLHRPTTTTVQGGDANLSYAHPITTVKAWYADTKGKDANQLANLKKWNLLGQAVATLDQSGLSASPFYGIDQQALANLQILTEDYQRRPDWSSSSFDSIVADVNAGRWVPNQIQQLDTGSITGLETERFTTFSVHNAAGELTQSIDPDGNVQVMTYYLTGQLASTQTLYQDTDDAYKAAVSFADMRYNARGQQTQTTAGNGVHTEHLYEPTTFRLLRVKSVRHSDNKVLQDLGYTYDPVGNVTAVSRHHVNTTYFNGQAVSPDSAYTHDSLYRLIEATGREHTGRFKGFQEGLFGRSGSSYQPLSQPLSNGNALQRYTEKYQYDAGGNLSQCQHMGTAAGSSYTRTFGIKTGSNQLAHSQLGSDSYAYTEDAHGNLLTLEGTQGIAWNERNNIDSVVLVKRNNGAPNDQEYYQYNAHGQRTRKVFEQRHDGNQTWIDEAIYLGGYEIRRRKNRSSTGNLTPLEDYRVVKQAGAIWRYQAGQKASTDPALAQQRYQLQDHLNSSTLEADHQGKIITYEEYLPYGGTALMAAENATEAKTKYYRYSFKERDQTTGLYYYGMRYYCTWLGRWLCPDPAGTVDGLNLYAFVSGNPVTLVDVGGMMPFNFSDWQANAHVDEPDSLEAPTHEAQTQSQVLEEHTIANEDRARTRKEEYYWRENRSCWAVALAVIYNYYNSDDSGHKASVGDIKEDNGVDIQNKKPGKPLDFLRKKGLLGDEVQKTPNTMSPQGFYAEMLSEVQNNRPVLLHLKNHFLVVTGVQKTDDDQNPYRVLAVEAIGGDGEGKQHTWEVWGRSFEGKFELNPLTNELGPHELKGYYKTKKAGGSLKIKLFKDLSPEEKTRRVAAFNSKNKSKGWEATVSKTKKVPEGKATFFLNSGQK